MSFNAQSYYRNKAHKRAMEALADARALRARVVAGAERWPGEGEHLASKVAIARSQWRVYLAYCRLDRMDEDLRLCRQGRMTYDEFMAKWGPETKEADRDFQR